MTKTPKDYDKIIQAFFYSVRLMYIGQRNQSLVSHSSVV